MVFPPSVPGGSSAVWTSFFLHEISVFTTDHAQFIALSRSKCQHPEFTRTCRYGHRQIDIPANRYSAASQLALMNHQN
jgi:hypothetical protein